MTTTYYARKDYTYESGDRIFTIPFSYLKESHIKVFINDEETENFSFNTSSQIAVNDELEAGDIVSVRRSTPIDARMVTFTNTSILNKDNQNISAQQTFNMVQEIYDNNTTFEIHVEGDIGDIQDEVDTANETANTALSNSQTAISTANTAEAKGDTAISTANGAVTTANQANTKSDNAVSTANSATQTANAASQLSNETKDRVDEFEVDIEEVKEAAAKINELEEAVATAVHKAGEALESAHEAEASATEATEAATTAVQKAQEISDSAAQIATNTTNIATNTADIVILNTGLATEITNRTNEDTAIRNAFAAADALLQAQVTKLQLLSNDVKATCLNFLQAGSAHNKLKIAADTSIKFKLGTTEYFYTTDADVEFNVSEKLDTGSIQAAKDYSVYLCPNEDTFDFVVSLNGTFPAGYSATTAYKIGGFHTLCVAVTSSNAPVLPSNSYFTSHPAIGYNAGDIIPNSVWCLTHRPVSEATGMVYVDRIDKWVDIYLQSGTFKNTASVFHGTTTDSRQPILHQFDMICVNKKLPTDNDFMVFAEGSNQKTNISGSADPVTTGGHVDTSNKRMISAYFVEDCCGALWQWLDEIGFNGQTNWTGYGSGAEDRGQSYGMPYVLRAGGRWDHGTTCGSWSRLCNLTRTGVYADSGCRGVSRSLLQGKVA